MMVLRYARLLLSAIAVLLAHTALAECARVSYTQLPAPSALSYVDPAYGRVGSWTGAFSAQGASGLPAVINLEEGVMQPIGTLLGSGVITLGQMAQPMLDPDQVLYRCTPDEEGKLYEFYATHAQDEITGQIEAGATVGLPRAYQTALTGMLLRMLNIASGQYFSHFWQRRPLTVERDGAGYLLVKVKHFSAIQVEALRGPETGGWSGPGAWPSSLPNGNLAFQGGGIGAGLRAGDLAASNRAGWPLDWPGAIGLWGNVTIRRSASCTVSTQGHPLLFAPISTASLAAGGTRSVSGDVQLVCNHGAVSLNGMLPFASGTVQGQSALGFLPAALLNIPGVDTRQFLLSDGYGSAADIATGVGIRLSDTRGRPLQLLASDAVGGSGWYPVLDDAVQQENLGATRRYRRSFTATLMRLPGQTPQAGRVRTRAYVLVKVQ
ncbi:fimbrial protein [Amantichitinum ursilacus]|uniref:Fimbrial-type adhesion domain-containing protein n=1 Tax=Amantichitinum ursilacus TaxID=857265 RepID=A0A0N0XLJ4_9NEIS|nr:fimbrial protein [Amantichitinum ursilacus]KPC53806.1 hypothetical protein WG78_06765 [Amantichitinum ursilacus]